MFLIGLTGGIAAGKSTVAKRWVENGATEIDADSLARDVVQPGSDGLRQVVQSFGESIIDDSGELNRKALAKLIFESDEKRLLLNSILHPLIRQLAAEQLKKFDDDAIVIYNVPLLVEAEVDHDFNLVVTVEAPEDEQIKRLVQTRGLSEHEAKRRIAAQAKPIERATRANRILNSNQDINLLLRDADNLWREIISLAKSARGN
jgi:dephospho-CoA kinase